jgi:hypothetical protein
LFCQNTRFVLALASPNEQTKRAVYLNKSVPAQVFRVKKVEMTAAASTSSKPNPVELLQPVNLKQKCKAGRT